MMEKVKVTIDGQEHQVPSGITLIQACDLVGVEIPRFCYHDRLSIAGNCRMCLVEMVGGPPKPIASCATNVFEGMNIKTKSDMTKNAREGAMKFLLANHPLDCPICDQAGECDLQDQAMFYGAGESEYKEDKRAVKEKPFGPLIKTEMTRCIHCTRCVRFATEIAGIEEIGAIGRGETMEISAYVEKTFSSELSGNIIDLCPVGALTSKPYSFKARPWELVKMESIDVHDAVGSNIRVDSRGGEVMRILPSLNEDINEEWISDKTRFALDGLKVQRLDSPYIKKNGKLQKASWEEAILEIKNNLPKYKVKSALAGDLADVESISLLKDLMNDLGSSNYDIRPSGSVLSAQTRNSYIFNSTIADIAESDLCLIIGSNPRIEAAIVNAKIGSRYRKSGLPIALLGVEQDLTYPYEFLGNSVAVLEEIITGKHSFSKKLKEAKKPLIILGEACFMRKDAEALLASINSLVKTYSVITKDWNGYNILHNKASMVGGLDLGFVPSEKTLDTEAILAEGEKAKSQQLVFLLGYDAEDVVRLKNSFNIYIGSHGDRGAHIADIILPAATYLEKSSLFVNMEGRIQRTNKISNPVGIAKEDFVIINELRKALGFKYFAEKQDFYDDLVARYSVFASGEELVKDNLLHSYKKGILNKTEEFIDIIDDFYMSNVIARNSKTMALCSQNNKENK